MGLFDFLKRDKGPEVEQAGPTNRKLASLTKTATTKKAQAYERDEALHGLIDYGTPDAVESLLKRFKLTVDPSITDQEEKQLAFDGIVSIGEGNGRREEDGGKDAKDVTPLSDEETASLRGAVIDKTRSYCQHATSLTWPLKVVRALLDDDAYLDEVLKLLEPMDTEYTRNVEPKLNLLAALESVRADRAREAAETYLEDVNETVRFHAVQTLFKQRNKSSIAPMVVMLQDEESVRIKNKVADGLIRRAWKIPESLREDFATALEDAHEYRMLANGAVEKTDAR